MLYSLWDYLEGDNKILVLTLDEIDNVRTTGEGIVYVLTRLTNAMRNVPLDSPSQDLFAPPGFSL